jgi:hypothetical protein
VDVEEGCYHISHKTTSLQLKQTTSQQQAEDLGQEVPSNVEMEEYVGDAMMLDV